MKTGFRIALGIAAAIALVIIGLGVSWFFWGRWLWAPSTAWSGETCAGWGAGWGMMQGGRSGAGWGVWRNCAGPGSYASLPAETIDIERAQEAVEATIQQLGNDELEIAELMEFERNFYAIVREHDTGIGAMELLVDKTSGAVGPEMGPNMMWNARYGMHRGGGMMIGRTRETNALSPDRAVQIAQRWLDTNRPGVTTEEHADPFYGYYTIHTLADGEIEGMLSVHGTTGQVWYHSWHGDFVRMIEGQEEHG